MEKYEVYISYSRKDLEIADHIERELTSRGISCFCNRADIGLGEVSAETIARIIYDCNIVLFIWTEISNYSEINSNEIALALSFKTKIISIRIGDFKPDFELAYKLVNCDRLELEKCNDKEVLFLVEKLAYQLGKISLQTDIPSRSEKEEPQYIDFKVFGVNFKMVKVAGGTFTMGATPEQGSDADDDEKPMHQVILSDYWIGETEVTQELWEAVMGSNPSYWTGNPKRPVENVSWNDIMNDFLPKLNKLTGKNFTLPTEAQWEFAARGGNKSRHYKYSGSNDIDAVAWYDGNDSPSGTKPVGQKQANELGLYDMSGNVNEWCSDWDGDYSAEAQTNPTGPASGSYRVLRGGNYRNYARYCRVSFRSHYDPGLRSEYNGLRLVSSH